MNLSNDIQSFLASYRSLSLEKTEAVKLMQRMDTKYVIRIKNRSVTNDWLSQHTPFRAEELSPALVIFFERITLINNEHTEKVTFDFNLHFHTSSGTVSPVFDRVAIVELKQDTKDYSRFYISSKNQIH